MHAVISGGRYILPRCAGSYSEGYVAYRIDILASPLIMNMYTNIYFAECDHPIECVSRSHRLQPFSLPIKSFLVQFNMPSLKCELRCGYQLALEFFLFCQEILYSI